MAIQFNCSACSQPIEVDDDLANQAVTCPYCRKAVTVPPQTTFDVTAIPTASPAPGPEGTATPADQAFGPGLGEPPGPKTNKFGWIALGCVVVCLASLLVLFSIGSSFVEGMEPEDFNTPQAQEEIKERAEAELQENPVLAIAFIGSCFGACATPVAALVFAILAFMRDTPPRKPAIAAVVIFGLVLILFCLNVLCSPGAAQGF